METAIVADDSATDAVTSGSQNFDPLAEAFFRKAWIKPGAVLKLSFRFQQEFFFSCWISVFQQAS